MLKAISRAERGLGTLDETKADFILMRTVAKRVVNGVMVHKAQTNKGEIIWSDADDTVPLNQRYILGIVKDAQTVVPFNVQIYKEA